MLVSLRHEITGIRIRDVITVDILAPRGASMDDFKVSATMSWAQERLTIREEDSAYCPQGISGVSVLVIYAKDERMPSIDHIGKYLEINRTTRSGVLTSSFGVAKSTKTWR